MSDQSTATKPQTYPAGQKRILQSLAKAGKTGLDGETLWREARLASRAWLSEYLGKKDSENDGWIMAKGLRTNVRKLVPSGLVKATRIQIEESSKGGSGIWETRYSLSPTGSRLAAKLGPIAERKSRGKSKPKHAKDKESKKGKKGK